VEPKPKYIVVGLFLVALSAASVGFVLWMYGYRGKEEYKTYVILTEESISGIDVGSPVRYKGVNVGKVTGIEIHPKDPNVVVIFMKIKKGVPIGKDTVARIKPIGITGLSYISLSGGKDREPYMVMINGKSYPMIRLELSEIQRVSRSLPELLANANRLLIRINRMFSDKNIENFSRISENLKRATAKLEELEDKLKELAEEYYTVGKKAEPLMERLNSLITTLNGTTTTFKEDTLKELKKAIRDSRRLIHQMESLTRKLKNDPSIFIHGIKGKKGPGEGE